MGKRIIFCADGTWDSKKNDTNVYKMYQAIRQGPDQVVFYDDGVGADGNEIQKLLGGAFGHGLFDKVKDGYAKIASVYEPGDEIYIFGFSRGAYTARSIAGMISACGLPVCNPDKDLVDQVFSAYRDPAHRMAKLGPLTDHDLVCAPIKMVGVWDTVGALGIPAVCGGVDPGEYGFLDTNLHPNVQNAYQALAIDEHRREFPPTLWTVPKRPVAGQTVEQVWFPGAHSDVGGGYPDSGLADVPLAWMMDKAEKLGLQIKPEIAAKYAAIEQDPKIAMTAALGTLHHSWNLLWGIPRWRHLPPHAVLSNSVSLRCDLDKTYRPRNLSFAGNAPDYKLAEVLPPVPAVTPSPANQDVQLAAAKPAMPKPKMA